MELNLLFKCITGSQSYGTNTENSDVDIKGVYIQSNDDVLGLNYKDLVSVTDDEVYYEIRRYVDLLSSANPSVLEMLFVEDRFVLYCHPSFQILRDNRHSFLTKKCKDSFGGMAVQQIKKAKGIDKKINWEKSQTERKDPIDFCTLYINHKSTKLKDYLINNNLLESCCGLAKIDNMKDCFNLYYSLEYDYKGIQNKNSNHILLSSIPIGEKPLCLLLYNEDAYSQHCRKYREYLEWLENRNMSRLVDTNKHGQKIDGKNISHAVRLIQMATEIAEKKDLIVYRPNREYLLDIRHGKFNLEDLIETTTMQLKELDIAFDDSDLPLEVTKEFKHALIIAIRKEYWGI